MQYLWVFCGGALHISQASGLRHLENFGTFDTPYKFQKRFITSRRGSINGDNREADWDKMGVCIQIETVTGKLRLQLQQESFADNRYTDQSVCWWKIILSCPQWG